MKDEDAFHKYFFKKKFMIDLEENDNIIFDGTGLFRWESGSMRRSIADRYHRHENCWYMYGIYIGDYMAKNEKRLDGYSFLMPSEGWTTYASLDFEVEVERNKTFRSIQIYNEHVVHNISFFSIEEGKSDRFLKRKILDIIIPFSSFPSVCIYKILSFLRIMEIKMRN
jgi:hypothetical protein